MEIRTLKYFLSIAKEESISRAAKSLHITQPTLSRQLKDLEISLGKELIIRGKKKVTLTDEGKLFEKRAKEILDLVEKSRSEILGGYTGGDIRIGCGETDGMRFIAKTVAGLQKEYPLIRVHLYSANAVDIMERLDKGLIDFGVLVNPPNLESHDFIKLPFVNICGLLMRKDSPLSSFQSIKPKDIPGIRLMTSRNETTMRSLSRWAGDYFESFNIVATYNLILNAALMVEEGVGYAYCLDRLIHIPEDSALCFRPLKPRVEAEVSFVWKRDQVFSEASKKFLNLLRAGV